MSDETKEPLAEAMAEITYVVQMLVHEGSQDYEGWCDIATVKVAPRTKRSTVIKQALAEAGIKPDTNGAKAKLRALDVDSAEIHEPKAHQAPMEWKL